MFTPVPNFTDHYTCILFSSSAQMTRSWHRQKQTFFVERFYNLIEIEISQVSKTHLFLGFVIEPFYKLYYYNPNESLPNYKKQTCLSGFSKLGLVLYTLLMVLKLRCFFSLKWAHKRSFSAFCFCIHVYSERCFILNKYIIEMLQVCLSNKVDVND